MSTSSAVGLLGGTFDPPHQGHLSLAISVLEQLELDEIHFIPCAQPLLRKLPIANASDRIAMLEAMIKPFPHFKVNNIEIKRGGNSYTIDTVMTIREKVGKDTSLCFIMSTDQFMQFDRWHQWERILDFVHLVVADRAGHPLILNQALKDFIKNKTCNSSDHKRSLHAAPCGSIFFEWTSSLFVSSSEIREKLMHTKKIPAFLSLEVWKYICEHGLYKL